MTHFALKFGSSTRSSAKHLKEVDPVRSKIARNIFFIPFLLGYVLVLLTCLLLAVESFHRKQDCSSRPPFSLVSDPFIWASLASAETRDWRSGVHDHGSSECTSSWLASMKSIRQRLSRPRWHQSSPSALRKHCCFDLPCRVPCGRWSRRSHR